MQRVSRRQWLAHGFLNAKNITPKRGSDKHQSHLVDVKMTSRGAFVRRFRSYFFPFLMVATFAACKRDEPVQPGPSTLQVRIVSPTSATILQDTVIIEIEVIGESSVSLVELYIDSQIPSGGSFTSGPYKYLWNVTSLSDSSIHTIYAKAYAPTGNVSNSSIMTVGVFKFTPTNLSAVIVSDTLIRMTWNDNSRKETAYEIERKINTGAFTIVKTSPANSTSADILGIYIVGDNISFRVRALADTISSKYSNVSSIVLAFPAPDNLSLAHFSATQVTLTWTDNSTFETGFEVERSISGGSFVELGTTAFNTITWSDASLDTTKTYEYRVRAITPHNKSAYSALVRASYAIKLKSIRTFAGNADRIYSVAISQDGTLLASGGRDGTARLWRISDGVAVRTLGTPNPGVNAVLSVAFSPDGQLIALGGNSLRLWRVNDGSIISCNSNHNGIQAVAFSSDGQLLASSGLFDFTAEVCRVSDGMLLRTLSGPTQPILSVAFSPDAQNLVTGDNDYFMKLWSLSDGSLLRTFSAHTNAVASVVFSPDGQKLASGSWDGTIRFWQIADSSLQRTVQGQSGSIYSVSFSSDWKLFATGGVLSTLSLWDVQTGTRLATIAGGSLNAQPVAFNPNGQTIATQSVELISGSLQYNIKLWEFPYEWQ